MAKRHNPSDEGPANEKGLSRREFFKQGAAAGVGAAVLAGTGAASAQDTGGITWDYEADVVICGGGASGLVSGILARDAGASVLIIDQNFDVGGKVVHSGGLVSLGGGDPVQMRDIAGEGDPEGFVTVPPIHKPEELTEDVDFLFRDLTDWSVVDTGAQAPYRYDEREVQRAWAEHAGATRQMLMDNYVRFARVNGTITNGGVSRARMAEAILRLGDTTDVKAGTVTRDDAGELNVHGSHFAPRVMDDMTLAAGPDIVGNGAALARPLDFSAREKGIEFILNRHMDEIIREEPFAGRVLGVRASYTPRIDPETGLRLESYFSNGNIEETRPTITIRARKALMISTGGHVGNPQFRSMFYPAMREPAFVSGAWAILGPLGQDASGMIAGMRIGANLAGMQQNLANPITFHIGRRIATRDSFNHELPGHPTFVFRKSTGINLGINSFEHLIAVNQVGKRFFNDIDLAKRAGSSAYPAGPGAGTPKPGLEHVQGDWRNATPDWVRQMYNRHPAVDAALAMNEGSTAPDYFSGPIWGIFDAAAVERDGWDINPPFTSEENGYFFKADTIAELRAKIEAGHEFQRVPLKYLEETVDTWNSYVDAGADPEFGRGPDAPMHKIDTAPFYAAAIVVIWQDPYGGLRINGKGQVIDTQGMPIPGLYAGGEVTGGTTQHGLGRCLGHGYMAGKSIVEELASA